MVKISKLVYRFIILQGLMDEMLKEESAYRNDLIKEVETVSKDCHKLAKVS